MKSVNPGPASLKLFGGQFLNILKGHNKMRKSGYTETELLKIIFDENQEIDECYLQNIHSVLNTLTEKEKFVISKRLIGVTLSGIGGLLSLTTERIRQIEGKAIRKLRHPTRKRKIMGLPDLPDLPKTDQDIDIKRLIEKNNLDEISVNTLFLSTRSVNCLKNNDIKTLSDLILKRESDLLRVKNCGRKSLNEIKGVLEGLGLKLISYK
jgi:hypothetical protein